MLYIAKWETIGALKHFSDDAHGDLLPSKLCGNSSSGRGEYMRVSINGGTTNGKSH